MDIESSFGTDYADCRARFRAAVAAAGAAAGAFANPHCVAPDGGGLTMDVARFGARDARAVLFILSATHGGEGFCGSGAQVATIQAGLVRHLPPGVAVVFVHAMNPYGFAHLSRTTEGNVDLNRNFIDFTRPVPVNTAYELVHPFMLPADWDGKARTASEEAIAQYITDHGSWAFQVAVTGGQYAHADGLFYGGDAPAWSNETFRAVIAAHAGRAEQVAILDYHTGLGPYGYGEPIAMGDAAAKARAARWFGNDVTDPEGGSSTSASLTGYTWFALRQAAPQAEATGIALEFGTLPVPDVLGALRADNWLRFRGDARSGLGRTIKKRMRDTFYCDFPDWRRMIVERGVEMTRRALDSLSQ